jgi:predicted permease
MTAFLLLLICPALGWIAARFQWMPSNAPAVINVWLLRIALPAVILEQIPRLNLDTRLLLPALGPLVLVLATIVLMPFLGRRWGWDRHTQGAMVLCWGLGNTSFVGFPLLIAVIGTQALGPAVISDQATFLCTTLIGVPVAAYYAGQQSSVSALMMRVLRFVPFQALAVATLIRLLNLSWWEPLDELLKRLGETLSPLALFAVGFQLNPKSMLRYLPMIGIGVLWKMISVPAAMWAGAWIMGVHGLPITVGILQVAMAPMITSGILAKEYGLNPEAANAMVSVGIAVSFVTVPMWYWLIGV